MKYQAILLIVYLFLNSCTSEKKLAYLSNLSVAGEEERFTMYIPDYKIQIRDILHITVKAMTPEGAINDFLGGPGASQSNNMQSESGGYLYGYDVKKDSTIILPVIGPVIVAGQTLDEVRILLQEKFGKQYKNSTVECKLVSFKFTVIGEVRMPGSYVNYNNYLTVLEAIGRAGGISDFGRRDGVTVVRPTNDGSKVYRLNLQDKKILTSEAYFLLPNDVVIVSPEKNKIFNTNLPMFTFILTSITSLITTTLLLINYFE